MPVVFTCSHCAAPIQVPDEALGKSAECPYCAQVQTVPFPSGREQNEEKLRRELEAYHDSGNPFEPPPLDGAPEDVTAAMAPPQEPVYTRVPLREQISLAWQMIFQLIPQHLLFGFLLLGLYICSIAPLSLVGFGVDYFDAQKMPRDMRWALQLTLMAAYFLFAFLFVTWIVMGVLRRGLFVARGGKGGYGLIFRGSRYWLRGAVLLLLGTILAGLWSAAAVFGSLAVIGGISWLKTGHFGPGPAFTPPYFFMLSMFTVYGLSFLGCLLLAARFAWSLFFVIDRDMGVVEAVAASWQFSRGNVSGIFWVGVLVTLLIGLTSGCCYLGLVVGPSMIVLVSSCLYLAITGQPSRLHNPALERSEW